MERVRSRRPPRRRLKPVLVAKAVVVSLLFVAISLFARHLSAGIPPVSERKLLEAPVTPISTLAVSTPSSQWSEGTMPHLYQIDPAWSEAPYAGGTVRENACGPTCLTMVYIWKTGNTDMTPATMAALADRGGYAPTGATEWSFMTQGAASLGLRAQTLGTTRSVLAAALKSGAAVIASVRPGTFTNVGHYIVLYGIDDTGRVTVYDPNSQSRSARTWGIVEVLDEVNALWAYY